MTERVALDDVKQQLADLRDLPDQDRNQAVTGGLWLAKQAWNATRRIDLRSYCIKAAAHFLLAAEILDAEAQGK